MKTIEEIKKFAEKAHQGQTRKDSLLPHFVHPQTVVEILNACGTFNKTIIAAAYCHDILEDTKITEKELVSVIGKKALQVVKELTKQKGESKEFYLRHLEEYGSLDAKIIKIADRIANTQDFIKTGKIEKAKEYLLASKAIYKSVKNFGVGKLLLKVYENLEGSLK